MNTKNNLGCLKNLKKYIHMSNKLSLKFIQAFVFDLDDTLYDEESFVRGGTNAVIEWTSNHFGMNHKELSAMMNPIMQSLPRNEWYQRMLEEANIEWSQGTIDKMVDIYRKHQPNIHLFPDASDFLRRITHIKEKLPKIFTGIITDGNDAVQEAKIFALELDELIDVCILTWRKGVEYQKPHIWSFRQIEKITGIFGTRCCYFGNDLTKDFLGPNQLGWETVYISRNKKKIDVPNNIYSARWAVSNFGDIILEYPGFKS
jgi:putative hydrolase of the HAD superfamily